MTLKDYARKINELAKKFPDAIIVYGKDDEGNSFHEVCFDPSPGHFEGRNFESNKAEINSVCIN